MAGVPVPVYQQFWVDKLASLEKVYQTKGKTHPEAVPSMQRLFKVLCDLEALAGCTPKAVGESEEWAAIIRAAEDNLETYSGVLEGKPLYSALYGNYTVALNELKSVLKSSSSARAEPRRRLPGGPPQKTAFHCGGSPLPQESSCALCRRSASPDQKLLRPPPGNQYGHRRSCHGDHNTRGSNQ
jgi:hypothetical protein